MGTCSKKSRVHKEFEKALAKAESTEFKATEEMLDLYSDVVCGCTLVAEENTKQMGGPTWQNAELCRTMLKYAKVLEQYTEVGNITDTLYKVSERMADALYYHPRLKAEVLRLTIRILHDIEAETGHDLSSTDLFMSELSALERNIHFADNGMFDNIDQQGTLKADPVEWTEAFENVIDEAERKALDKLTDVPRGMGFCHAYWTELGDALYELGVSWKSPAQMNPRCLFD